MIADITEDELKILQDGHGNWTANMSKYLGKAGTVSYKYTDGDMKVKFDGENEYCWFWALVSPSEVGCKAGAHTGAWRGPETKYWCSTASMTEGQLCTHGSEIIKAPHWNCCGSKER